MTCKTTFENIYTYERQALDSIPKDHPNYEEIKELLMEQIKDDLDTNAHTITN